MRIWSLHPKYLDARGLVALWREGLLAQAVLRGKTRGYIHHPQLVRFREQVHPLGLLSLYLRPVYQEAVLRGYRFSANKIFPARTSGQLTVTRGQLDFEWQLLMEKLRTRDPAWRARLESVTLPEPHPLFRVRRGGIAEWEKGASKSMLIC